MRKIQEKDDYFEDNLQGRIKISERIERFFAFLKKWEYAMVLVLNKLLKKQKSLKNNRIYLENI